MKIKLMIFFAPFGDNFEIPWSTVHRCSKMSFLSSRQWSGGERAREEPTEERREETVWKERGRERDSQFSGGVQRGKKGRERSNAD